MAKKIFFLILLSSIFVNAFATHNRAGEITFKHISGYTYEITVTTITYSPSTADRNELEVSWGDGTTSTVARVNGPGGYNVAGIYCLHLGENIAGYKDVQLNKYTTTHSYSGTGTFIISVEDPNRNYGVMNIPNSVNVPFYIETLLMINPFLGSNDSPQLTMLPVDKACVGITFITNAGAYDPDGDSLSYELTSCRGTNGNIIAGYSLPPASSYFVIDEITGDITWETPSLQGEFNVAFIVKEWRNGTLIGYIIRDFQIIVSACDNNPPVINNITDTCVFANDTLNMSISATDIDGDYIKLIATGEPFFLEPTDAKFVINDNIQGTSNGTFSWTPNCYDVRKEPYVLYLKATDQDNIVNLSTISNTAITVIAKAPQNLDAEAISRNVFLSWDNYECQNALGFNIYRSQFDDNHEVDYCVTGMPYNWGYIKIYSTTNVSDNYYTDVGDMSNLSIGLTYSYRISAYFNNNTESVISDKATVTLKKDLPVITNVSVLETDSINGSMMIALSPPTEIDTVIYPGPYKYYLYRYNHNNSQYDEIKSASDLSDSIFYDYGINTENLRHSYYIALHHCPAGAAEEYMGKSEHATSIFLETEGNDRKAKLSWNCLVPWLIDYYTIYRNNAENSFDSIASTTKTTYVDSLLENHTEYCYIVSSTGRYNSAGYVFPIINNSQIQCCTPVDTDAPCPPQLYLKTICETSTNILQWTNPESSCCDDVAGYYIYHQATSTSEFSLIDSVMGNSNDTIFEHYNDGKIFGCYYVTAIDYNKNISNISNIVCAIGNECTNYVLPNVFSPNGDGYNDLFKPKEYSNIKSVDTKIYNRQGRLVFASKDIEINWDGKDYLSKRDVSIGVYFYVCIVTIYTFDGEFETVLSGDLHILR